MKNLKLEGGVATERWYHILGMVEEVGLWDEGFCGWAVGCIERGGL